MNKSNARDYLPLVQALADGKVIQFKVNRGGLDEWRDMNQEEITFGYYDPHMYRIKPEPREVWVNRFPDGHDGLTWYETEEAAYRAYGCVGAVQVRYREVIDGCS